MKICDHYFCKDKYPILRLSFYNLIPSCETCNTRVKRKLDFEYNQHSHPYEEGFHPQSVFVSLAKDVPSSIGNAENYSITLNSTNPRHWENFNEFRIKEVYEQHGDLLSELYKLKHRYGKNYLTSLLTNPLFQGSNTEDLYRQVFSNYLYEEGFKKRPFSKLTKDIVDQLELI